MGHVQLRLGVYHSVQNHLLDNATMGYSWLMSLNIPGIDISYQRLRLASLAFILDIDTMRTNPDQVVSHNKVSRNIF